MFSRTNMKIFWSESFSIRDYKGRAPHFRARVAKKRPAFRYLITSRKSRVQNCVMRGRYRLRKTKNTFSAHNEQGNMKGGKSVFQNKYEIFLVRVILDT